MLQHKTRCSKAEDNCVHSSSDDKVFRLPYSVHKGVFEAVMEAAD